MIRLELCKRLNFNWIRLPVGIGMGVGGHPAATTTYGANPNGEALAWVVVVGRGLQVTDDSIGSS
jgi:hypothetical protein